MPRAHFSYSSLTHCGPDLGVSSVLSLLLPRRNGKDLTIACFRSKVPLVNQGLMTFKQGFSSHSKVVRGNVWFLGPKVVDSDRATTSALSLVSAFFLTS